MKEAWNRIYPILYTYRFEVFFFSTILTLFGSLVMPVILFENFVSKLLFYVNLITGLLLISKNKKISWFFGLLLLITVSVLGSSILITGIINNILDVATLLMYFLFYLVVTFEIIKQIWITHKVDERVIFGVVNGYISLALIGFFICMTIELSSPNSFSGIKYQDNTPAQLTDEMIYFSSVTLLTIGYGDMYPTTLLAKKATVLIGFMGQFYTMIITAIIIGKYNNQN